MLKYIERENKKKAEKCTGDFETIPEKQAFGSNGKSTYTKKEEVQPIYKGSGADNKAKIDNYMKTDTLQYME